MLTEIDTVDDGKQTAGYHVSIVRSRPKPSKPLVDLILLRLSPEGLTRQERGLNNNEAKSSKRELRSGANASQS